MDEKTQGSPDYMRPANQSTDSNQSVFEEPYPSQTPGSAYQPFLHHGLLTILSNLDRNEPFRSLSILDQMWLEWPEEQEEIARTALSFSPTMDVDIAKIWSGRARWLGSDELCPLEQIAQDSFRPFPTRFRAAFALFELFSARERIIELLGDLSSWGDDMLQMVLGELATVEPPAALMLARVIDQARSAERISSSELRGKRQVVWAAPVLNSSGMGDEARGFLGALRPGKIKIEPIGKVESRIEENYFSDPDKPLGAGLALQGGEVNISVLHAPVDSSIDIVRRPKSFADYQVMRTMFEADGLPKTAVNNLNQFDEVWVPGKFNLATFLSAGVKTPIYVIGGGIDSQRYLRSTPIFSKQVTRFLSVFDWQERKGWRTLVEAWSRAFSAGDPVELYLKVSRFHERPTSNYYSALHSELEDLIYKFAEQVGSSKASLAPIVVNTELLSESAYEELFQLADVYVCPSYGEGWGRPYMQAMSAGLPTIGTDWGGQTEFMNSKNSYLIRVEALVQSDGLEFGGKFSGHKWAKPSVEHLSELMRQVVVDKESARKIGLTAMQDMAKTWSWERVAGAAELRLQAIEKVLDAEASNRAEVKGKAAGRIKVNWKGNIFGTGSLAKVNLALLKEYLRGVQSSPISIEIDHSGPIVTNPRRVFSGCGTGIPELTSGLDVFDIEIRHQWPPDFSAAGGRRLLVIFPWEFQEIPQQWVTRISRFVDQVWTPSEWTKSVLVNGGLEPEIVKVIPNGIDPQIYQPEGGRRVLSNSKSFRFLYVGGMIYRKGFDLLIQSFCEVFSSDDDVALVIKAAELSGAYRNSSRMDLLQAAMSIPGGPAIELVTEDLSEPEMAELYRSCDTLVLPYRGEGFGMPILEAMACGLPVLVPDYGPAPEFSIADSRVDFTFSNRVKVFQDNLTSDREALHLFEPNREDFKAALIRAISEAKSLRSNAIRNSEIIRERYSWSKVYEAVEQELIGLSEHPSDSQKSDKSERSTRPDVISVESVSDWPLRIEAGLLRSRNLGPEKMIVEIVDGGYVTQAAVENIVRTLAAQHKLGDSEGIFELVHS